MNRERTIMTVLPSAVLAVVLAAGCSATQEPDTGDDSTVYTVQTTGPAPGTSPPPVPTPVPTSPPVQTPTADPPRAWVQGADSVAVETSAAPTRVPGSTAPSKAPVKPPAPAQTTRAPAPQGPASKPPVPPSTRPATRPATSAPVPAGNTVRIGTWSHGYVTAYGSQAIVDACKVVEWEPLWFAGHDYCGYAFWASLPVGQKIVLTGKNAGTYTVTNRVYLSTQGGKKPALPAYDLALQTCKGSGTQLVLATKTG